MKYPLNNIRMIQFIGLVILTLTVQFATVAAILPANFENPGDSFSISKLMTDHNNSTSSEEDNIKSTLDAYFTTRYEGQKLLQTQDFSMLVEDNNQPWVKMEQDKREIELYNANLFYLQYINYQYSLDYKSITIENDQASVQLSESHQVVFKAIAPQVSEIAGLQHTFTLKKNTTTG